MVLAKVKTLAKKEWKKAKADPMGTAAKALSLAKFLASVINVEHKVKDFQFARAVISSTPTIQFISGTSQGDGQFGMRNGDSIKLTSVSIRGLITQATGQVPKQVRVMVINDLSPNGALPNYYEILDNSVLSNLYARYNPDFAGTRFKVLYDKRMIVDSTRTSQKFSFYRKLNHHAKYKGNGDTVANAATGHYFVMIISDDTAGDANDPSAEFTSCIRYVDN